MTWNHGKIPFEVQWIELYIVRCKSLVRLFWICFVEVQRLVISKYIIMLFDLKAVITSNLQQDNEHKIDVKFLARE